jgi:hypothetical protein
MREKRIENKYHPLIMVHGTNYGIHFVVRFLQPMDTFDDFLPLCISLRKMLRQVDSTKVCILEASALERRLGADFSKYVEAQSLLKRESRITRDIDKFQTEYMYYDAYVYSTQMKSRSIARVSEEEFHSMKARLCEFNKKLMEFDSHITKADMEEFQRLIKTYEIQLILYNSAYLQKIVELEGQLTDICLTDEEKQMIDAVKSNPLLEGKIESYGFELVQSEY